MALDLIGVGEKRTPTFLFNTSSHENPATAHGQQRPICAIAIKVDLSKVDLTAGSIGFAGALAGLTGHKVT